MPTSYWMFRSSKLLRMHPKHLFRVQLCGRSRRDVATARWGDAPPPLCGWTLRQSGGPWSLRRLPATSGEKGRVMFEVATSETSYPLTTPMSMPRLTAGVLDAHQDKVPGGDGSRRRTGLSFACAAQATTAIADPRRDPPLNKAKLVKSPLQITRDCRVPQGKVCNAGDLYGI